MNPLRRRWLMAAAAAAMAPSPGLGATVRQGQALVFPRDHGAHPEAQVEWWYATGWAGPAEQPQVGYQVTFFRSRTGVPVLARGRFAAPQLLFAHVALTDLPRARHHHAQRLVRWNGDPGAGTGAAALHDGRVHLGRWRLWRESSGDGSAWRAQIDGELSLDLVLQRSQAVLLQGDAGFSRKGPDADNASHYYTEPQLLATARWRAEGRGGEGRGLAWLDQEWSDALLHPEAVGWDWIGMNLFDGSALTAFRLRRADGHAAGPVLWGGGSFRRPGGASRSFAPGEVSFVAQREWTSPSSGTRYPVQWQVDCPAGRFVVRALLDAQELDNRASTGLLYWEGLSELLDEQGRRVGLGYLELTGYGQRLRL